MIWTHFGHEFMTKGVISRNNGHEMDTFWSWIHDQGSNFTSGVARMCTCGHEMNIFWSWNHDQWCNFTAGGAKMRSCGHEMGTFWPLLGMKFGTFLAHFSVHGINCATCVRVVSRILLPQHETLCTCGGLSPMGSPSLPQHQFSLYSPFPTVPYSL